jgi:hypothetical protein
MLVYGYHGTSRESAMSILGTAFEMCNRNDDWLGKGVYFWQDAPLHANWWAREYKRYDDPVVLCSEIYFNPDFCIDLLDSTKDSLIVSILRSSSEQVNRSILRKRMEERQRGLQDYSGSWFSAIDKHTIDFATQSVGEIRGRPVKAVRSIFQDGEKIHSTSRLYDMSHVQLVVIDPTIIMNTTIFNG